MLKYPKRHECHADFRLNFQISRSMNGSHDKTRWTCSAWRHPTRVRTGSYRSGDFLVRQSIRSRLRRLEGSARSENTGLFFLGDRYITLRTIITGFGRCFPFGHTACFLPIFHDDLRRIDRMHSWYVVEHIVAFGWERAIMLLTNMPAWGRPA